MSSAESRNVKVTAKDFLLRYVKYIPLFVIAIVIALLIAFLYLRYTVPYYNTRATLLIKTSAQTAANTELDYMFFNNARSNVSNEIEILKSLNLAKRVASSLKLQSKVYTKGNVKTSLIYPSPTVFLDIIKLKDSTAYINFNIYIHNENEFSFDNVESKRHVFGEPYENHAGVFRITKTKNFVFKPEFREMALTWEPLESAAFFVLGGLNVTPIKDQSNILQLSYVTPQPVLGVHILNQLMVEYQKLNVEDKRQTASQTIAFINERLNIITKELGDVEKDLQQYKQEKGITDLETQSRLFVGNQAELEKEISAASVRKEILQYLQEYLADQKNANVAVPTTLGVSEPTLLEQVKQYNQLQIERGSELRTTTENNPLIKSIDIRLEKIRSDLLENLRNLKEVANLEIENLKRRNSEYSANISTVPIREKELLEISRQQGIKQSLYLFLFQTREQTLISQAATVSNSQVLDEAIINWTPMSPKPFNARALAVFLGLLVPVGFIYLRELFNDKINSRGDITRVTDAPIFGEIGHSQAKTVLLVQKNRRDIVTEQFRMIRTNMKFLVNKVQTPVILVTSTFSGEGKSFVSLNTAAVMALAGMRTAVLEFDIRKPKIMSGLNLPKSQGITNFLVSDVPLESLPLAVPGVDNLFVIPCGPIPPNPAETLLNPKINDLFKYLRANFDMIIIDSPPVGLVSDAFTLSQFADASLYLTRIGHTLKKQVHFIDEIYEKNKLPNMGILVNDIKASSHYYSYGNYGGYGYGYGYGERSGYFDAEPRKGSRWFRKLFNRFKRTKG